MLCLWVAILSHSAAIYLPALFFGVMFFMSCTPTLNATIANISAPNARAMAFATAIFCMHALGDTISPMLFGRVIQRTNLEVAFLWMPLALLISAAVCVGGVFTIRRDTQKTLDRVTQVAKTASRRRS